MTTPLLRDLRTVLLVGLALRLLWAWWVPVLPVSDSAMYDEFARSIQAGHGYAFADGRLTAFWPVGTSALYALLYALFGVGHAPIVALNLLLGLAVIWLTHAIAARYFNAAVAVAATWVVACWPLLIQFTTILASELLFTALLLAALQAWGSERLPRVPRALAWAALLCAAVYVRPTVSPLFVALPLLQWLRDRDLRAALLSLLVAGATAAALFAPWVLRNHEVFGRYVLVSANFGSNLWMGNNPQSDGSYMRMPQTSLTNPVLQDELLKQQAIDFIRAHPLRYAELSVRRIIITYGRETIGVVWNEAGLTQAASEVLVKPLKVASTLYWLAVLAAALAGIAIAVRRHGLGLWHPLSVVTALLFVVPVLTVGQDRYHVPMDPLLAIFAAVAWCAWRTR